MSTSLEGFGGTLPPPMTNIEPLKLNARVSPVALGIGAIDPMVLATGSKLNELVVSTTEPPWKSEAPATWMMPFMVQVGANMIPTGAFTFSVHLDPSAALGSNSQIPLVEATLMLNPP